MASVLLNNIEHHNLKIILKKSAEYGDAVPGCVVVPKEFAEVQKDYPIVFQKDEDSGGFQAVALFGFYENENLFLSSSGWDAGYIPAVMEREPFLIGVQGKADSESSLMIRVDMMHPRVSQTDEGEPVFLEHGGRSHYLNHVARNLILIHEGLSESQEFFKVLLQLDVVERLKLDIEFHNGDKYISENYYTINQEKFSELDSNVIFELFNSGYLFYIYMILASMANIKKLVRRRNML